MERNELPERPYAGLGTGEPAPWVKTSAECAYDALIVAAATMISAQLSPRAASRMALLVCARRTGLARLGQGRDVLADLDTWLDLFRRAPAARRRVLVSTMTMLVGSPWARMVREAAEQVGAAGGSLDPSGRVALLAIERALALSPVETRPV